MKTAPRGLTGFYTLYYKVNMRIIRAEHLGMCFGVRDAIALALKQSETQPLTILGDLVHNERVLAELRDRGIRIARHAGAVQTAAAMVTAHGASEKAIKGARDRGLSLTEATCPLVRVAHRAVARLVREGYHPVIIGKRDHVEVRGLTEDLADFDVVLSEADLLELRERARFGVAAQTTQPIERVRRLVELLRLRFPRAEVRFIDTVCQPTKQRQNAALELARQSDVVVVIGGAHSNNTHELVRACSRDCSRVHHVQTAGDLRPEWFAQARTVGITAGTSTPDSVIDEVEQWLLNLDCAPGMLPRPQGVESHFQWP
jgi:4-hydroxy-3-methylbut-2-enyl diphosphate reductase